MESKFSKTFTIGEAARLSGVSAKRIRYWESMGFIPTAERVCLGERSYRGYTEDDLVILKTIKLFLNEGYSLSGAVKKAEESVSNDRGDKNHE